MTWADDIRQSVRRIFADAQRRRATPDDREPAPVVREDTKRREEGRGE